MIQPARLSARASSRASLPRGGEEAEANRVALVHHRYAHLGHAGQARHRAQREILRAVGRQLLGRCRLEGRDGPATGQAQGRVRPGAVLPQRLEMRGALFQARGERPAGIPGQDSRPVMPSKGCRGSVMALASSDRARGLEGESIHERRDRTPPLTLEWPPRTLFLRSGPRPRAPELSTEGRA